MGYKFFFEKWVSHNDFIACLYANRRTETGMLIFRLSNHVLARSSIALPDIESMPESPSAVRTTIPVINHAGRPSPACPEAHLAFFFRI